MESNVTKKPIRVLYLNVHKKWFDLIASGEKNEEYREIKEYWLKRLFEHFDYSVLNHAILQKVICHLNYYLVTTSELYDWAGWKPKQFDFVCFRNGYSKDAPEVWCGCEGIEIGTAKPELSDNAPGFYFKIQLGRVLAAPVVLD